MTHGSTLATPALDSVEGSRQCRGPRTSYVWHEWTSRPYDVRCGLRRCVTPTSIGYLDDRTTAEEDTVFELVLTIVVLLAVAAAILLFERPRAEQIERDLHEQAADRRDAAAATPDPEQGPETEDRPDDPR